jgi:hypothetical protein
LGFTYPHQQLGACLIIKVDLDFDEAHKTNIMVKVAHLQNMAIQDQYFSSIIGYKTSMKLGIQM